MSFDVIANGWRKLLKNGGVGYTEPAKTICSIPLSALDNGSGGFYSADKYVLEADKMYQVTTDSGTYNVIAKSYHVEGMGELIVIGNAAFTGMAEDTGESFACANYLHPGDWTYHLDVTDFNGGSHMTVSEAETVHTIDPKYLFPRVELKTKLYNDEFMPYRYKWYPVTARDFAALEEARKCGIFYLSAHVADPDCNPWHIGGIPTMKESDDDSNVEYYEVLSNYDDVYISLQLERDVLDGVGTWSIASLTGIGFDGSYTNSGEEFPVPE